MNNRAAAAVVCVFLLVAVLFGDPQPSGADGTPEGDVAVQGDR